MAPPAEDPDSRSPLERFLAPKLEDAEAGPHLSRTAMQRPRSLEGYFKSGDPPRWMLRLLEIERGIAGERRRLAEAYRALRARCAGQPEQFAQRWRDLARSWPFDELNELIRQHNEWFPIERRLPVDPRTRDYVLIHGRSYRKPELGPDWVLEQFPAERRGE